jgi:hypothetical protein
MVRLHLRHLKADRAGFGALGAQAIADGLLGVYDVDVDDHSLILAENTPAEVFVDNVDRLAFDNWAEHQPHYPEGKDIIELPYHASQGPSPGPGEYPCEASRASSTDRRRCRFRGSGLICNFNHGGAEKAPPSFLLEVATKNLLTASYH